ncbi:hypothetical protein [Streptomyces pharetrae]|uniref:hypothetical protein n=1 Tax=Streptomyces pharetrae TaxID=291370 RepID=UPI003673E901
MGGGQERDGEEGAEERAKQPGATPVRVRLWSTEAERVRPAGAEAERGGPGGAWARGGVGRCVAEGAPGRFGRFPRREDHRFPLRALGDRHDSRRA